MCRAVVLWLFVSLAAPLAAQQTSAGPENEKAQKTYKEAFAYLQQHRTDAALDSFKKADKQGGGRCLPCQKNMIKYGVELHDWKTAEFAAGEIVTEAQVARDVAIAHCQLGIILIDAGLDRHKAELFARAHDEMTKALAADASFSDALFADGQALAHLKQDDAAKAQFHALCPNGSAE